MTSHGPADLAAATLRRAAPSPIEQQPSTTKAAVIGAGPGHPRRPGHSAVPQSPGDRPAQRADHPGRREKHRTCDAAIRGQPDELQRPMSLPPAPHRGLPPTSGLLASSCCRPPHQRRTRLHPGVQRPFRARSVRSTGFPGMAQERNQTGWADEDDPGVVATGGVPVIFCAFEAGGIDPSTYSRGEFLPTLADLFGAYYLVGHGGVHFSSIRVHYAWLAHRACQVVFARTFTVGSDNIDSAHGAFAPQRVRACGGGPTRSPTLSSSQSARRAHRRLFRRCPGYPHGA